MKRIGFVAIVVTAMLGGLVGSALAIPVPAAVDFDYSPTSGPAGTVVTASGNCDDLGFPAEANAADAPAGFSGESGIVSLELSKGSNTLAQTTVDMNMDRSWEAMLTVPANTPAGDYDLDATCEIMFDGDSGARPAGVPDEAFGPLVLVLDYVTQIFTVTAQPATTAGPTSTAGPTTTAPAVAAQAQRAQPSFTG